MTPELEQLIEQAWQQSYLDAPRAAEIGRRIVAASRHEPQSLAAGFGWLHVALAEVRIGDADIAAEATAHAREVFERAGHARGTALADEVPAVANVRLDALEHGEDVVFMHSVSEGPASRSFGIAVARRAGVPNAVIARARTLLDTLERRHSQSTHPELPQLPLFERPHPALEALRELDPDGRHGVVGEFDGGAPAGHRDDIGEADRSDPDDDCHARNVRTPAPRRERSRRG